MANRKCITPPAAGPHALADEDLVNELRELGSLIGFLGELEGVHLDPETEGHVRHAVIDRLLDLAQSGLARAQAVPPKAPQAVA
jgi:hypothetical protein